MKKDAFYFPHYSNARNDAKIIKLRRILGIEGYGLYFMLLEILREQANFEYPLSGIEDLAYEWHISKEKIASVVNDFDLFEIIDNKFFSPKLILYLRPYIEKSRRARDAALIRWRGEDVTPDANALQMHCGSNADQNAINKYINKEDKIRIINDLMSFFGFNEIKNSDKYRDSSLFVNILCTDGKIDYYKSQFESYKKYKKETCEKIHSFRGFIGTIKERFLDGGWNSRNWEHNASSASKQQSSTPRLNKI